MKVSLTDFDSQQLQTLLDIVVLRVAEEDAHKKEWIKTFCGKPYWFSQDEADAYYDRHQRPERSVNYEHLCLWRTQILDAIGKVGVREIVESN